MILLSFDATAHIHSSHLTATPPAPPPAPDTLQKPVKISQKDLYLLKKSMSYYPTTVIAPDLTNSRPIQATNSRVVKAFNYVSPKPTASPTKAASVNLNVRFRASAVA